MYVKQKKEYSGSTRRRIVQEILQQLVKQCSLLHEREIKKHESRPAQKGMYAIVESAKSSESTRTRHLSWPNECSTEVEASERSRSDAEDRRLG